MSVHYQKLPSIGNNASDVKLKKKNQSKSKQRKEPKKTEIIKEMEEND